MKNNPALVQWGILIKNSTSLLYLKSDGGQLVLVGICSQHFQILNRLLTSCNHPSLNHYEWVISAKQVQVITDDMTMS